MKNTKGQWKAMMVFALFTGVLLSAGTVKASTVKINDKNFPDIYFQEYVSAAFDKNEDGSLSDSEREAVTELDVGDTSEYQLTYEYLPIQTLKGIEYFSNIETLNCSYNALDELDVSSLKKLSELRCNENQLKALHLSGNRELRYLYCQDNSIKRLSCSNNKKLRELYCDRNQLKKLDISSNKKLRVLSVAGNKLKKINVRKQKQLTKLYVNDNKLVGLDLSHNPNITSLYASNNKLQKLSLRKNRKLDFLSCSYNRLRKLNLKSNKLLRYLYCRNNQLVTGNLYISRQGLEAVDVSGQSKSVRAGKTKKGYRISLAGIQKTNVLTKLSAGKVTDKGIVLKGKKLPSKITYRYNMFMDGNTKETVTLYLKK